MTSVREASDGCKNKKRVLPGGGATFDRIIQNISDCITIRYNLGETIALTYLHSRTVEEMRRRYGD